MKIMFVRHPETQANVNRIIYGRTDSPYSDKGKASVGRVAEELAEVEIDEIYSSPLPRAANLAKAIAQGHRKGLNESDIVMDDRIREMYFGLFENKTNEEAREIYGDGYDKFWHDFVNFQVPEGENLHQVRDRTVDFLKEIVPMDLPGESFEELMKEDPAKAVNLHDRNDKTILIVAHSIVIRGALSFLLDISLEWIWHIDVKPASIIEISYHRGFGVLSGIRRP